MAILKLKLHRSLTSFIYGGTLPILAFLSMTQAAGKPSIYKSFKIKYISKNNVYLKGGLSDGLAEGDTLFVYSKKRNIAQMVAIYVSRYSASCKLIKAARPLKPGQTAILRQKTLTASKPASSGADSSGLGDEKLIRRKRVFQLPSHKITSGAKQTFARLNGYAAYQQLWEFPKDPFFSANRRQYRLYLRMRGLMGAPLNFKMSLSSHKYDKRSASSTGENEWKERLSALSFLYQGRKVPFDVSAGRISPRVMSGVGYIDGGLLTLKNKTGNGITVFGGREPELLYYQSSHTLSKYGAYANWDAGKSKGFKWDSWIGWAGEYKGGSISREYIYAESEASWKRRVSFSQSGEFDINRGWRSDKEKSGVAVTNLYLNLSWSPSRKLRFSAQYDTRKRYYEYATRTLADSLFDMSHREGWRGNLSWRMTKKTSLYLGYGAREMSAAPGISHLGNLGLNIRNLFWRNLMASGSLAGNRSKTTKGCSGSLNLRQTFKSGNSLFAGYSLYEYWYKYETSLPSNHFSLQAIQTGANLETPWRVFASAQYEFAFKNDGNHHRISAESGYRF